MSQQISSTEEPEHLMWCSGSLTAAPHVFIRSWDLLALASVNRFYPTHRKNRVIHYVLWTETKLLLELTEKLKWKHKMWLKTWRQRNDDILDTNPKVGVEIRLLWSDS